MRSVFSPHRRRLAPVAMAALALFTACTTDGPSAVSNARPAALAVRALVPRTAASAGPAAVRIAVSYLRANGTAVALGSPQQFSLDQATQNVPVSVDVATCLADGARGGTGGAAPAVDECHVQLTLDFLLNGVSVDQQVLSDVVVKPGQTSTISQPVALAQVSDLRVVIPAANTQGASLQLEAGTTATLSALVIDANGTTLTGRTITWASANPTVATVNSAGLVTAVAVGGTQITASAAGRTVTTATVVTVPTQLITVASSGASGQGRILSAPAGIDCLISGAQTTGVCALRFPSNVNVQLAASAGSNSDFAAFAGDCATVQGVNCTVVPTAARQVTVGFRARQSLTVNGVASGDGTIVSNDGTVSCTLSGASANGQCIGSFAEGSTVQLTAAVAPGSSFQGWQGDCAATVGAVCTLTMSSARTASPRFVRNGSLRVTGLGNGDGTVTATGIACTITSGSTSGTCTSAPAVGTVVTLTAIAGPGSSFTGWSGACSGTGACSVTVANTHDVHADFTRTGMPLTLTVDGPAGGTISTNTGEQCTSTGSPLTCVFYATPNTTLTLTASPGSFLLFNGFTGACRTSGSCVLVMTQPRVVDAVFKSRSSTMWLVLGGTGAGTVTTDTTWNCALALGQKSSACSATLASGRSVRFTAVAQPGSTFTGWSGPCTGLLDCVAAADNISVGATFQQNPATVRVLRTAGGGGTGQVIFGPTNARCTITTTGTSGVCSLDVTPGTTMRFAIDPSVGTPFAGWGGACASFGTNPVCTLTASSSVDVTARFQ